MTWEVDNDALDLSPDPKPARTCGDGGPGRVCAFAVWKDGRMFCWSLRPIDASADQVCPIPDLRREAILAQLDEEDREALTLGRLMMKAPWHKNDDVVEVARKIREHCADADMGRKVRELLERERIDFVLEIKHNPEGGALQHWVVTVIRCDGTASSGVGDTPLEALREAVGE